MKITVVGTGYVGMSMCILLAQKNKVVALDINQDRVDLINSKKSTIHDEYIEDYIQNKQLDLLATTDKKLAYRDSDFIVIATPTDYDPETNFFDTSSVDSVAKEALAINKKALIVIKSTIPVGHTQKLKKALKTNKIVFFPEFLREGNALYDNLYPSRIVADCGSLKSKKFSKLLQEAAIKKNIQVIEVSSMEAEAIKLFSNTYLAMRVAFFNELDNYAMSNDLITKNIIDAVSLDPRIGNHYNNPSFGYGGYCLPKDTKQLLANYKDIPQKIINAIIESNETRKDFIASEIISIKPKSVGFYRLIAKQGSDNFRDSAIHGIINRVLQAGIKVSMYEPSITNNFFNEIRNFHNFEEFNKNSDLIVSNRVSNDLKNLKYKVFTRDIFGTN